MSKKLKMGWFSFSCCNDSTIVFTELLNTNFQKWEKLIEFQYFPLLKKKNKLTGLDVAFVEGAIAKEEDKKRLKQIRKNCKRLIAIGSCAVNAEPAGQRNDFNKKKKKEIEQLVKKLKLCKKVHPLSDIVKIDDLVSGCPMSERKFILILNKQLKYFKIIK